MEESRASNYGPAHLFQDFVQQRWLFNEGGDGLAHNDVQCGGEPNGGTR